MNKITLISLILIVHGLFAVEGDAQNSLKIAKLKYNGGGDWYANKTALPNLIKFCNEQLGTSIAPDEDIIEVGSKELYLYPYLYMTGHGNVVFSESEAANLRNYLLGGGFLHIDDNYGLDEYIRFFEKNYLTENP